jgi:predicted ATPase/signal transduction histidine kinase/CheY-like chemotaxis protein
MINLKNFKVLNQLHSGQSLVVKAKEIETDKHVIIKLPSKKYVSALDKKNIIREFDFCKKVFKEGVTLHSFGATPAIILDDFEGTPLNELILNNQPSLIEKIEILISAVKNLDKIHSRNILHNNINPSNLIYNRSRKKSQIIDFESATEFDGTSVQNISMENSTLLYISPEQTGRTNNGVDKRSDYYSLGVTFYEVLTQKLPFQLSDPLEIIHAHIAQQPDVINSIPAVFSDIILKLLQKDPNKRYQSLDGLTCDLQRCHKEILESNTISNFIIGENDVSSQLIIPDRIYGNNEANEKILSIINNINEGNKTVTFVVGESGFGKSTIIKNLTKPIIENGAVLISGKYHQSKTPTPCSAILSALEMSILSILKEDHSKKMVWKNRIIEALGDNSSVITNTLPKLKQLLENSSELLAVDSQFSENRFYYTLSTFISLFATERTPLVIALDNSQWMDRCSVQLIKNILLDKSIGFITFICFGTNENSFSAFKGDDNSAFESGEIDELNISEIELQSLSKSDVLDLLSETLHLSLANVSELGELLYTKTKGNPYFLRQQILSLYSDKRINFNLKDKKWQWDIQAIKQLNISDNVVELLSNNINRLSDETQELLKVSSVIGSTFSYRDLSIFYANAIPTSLLDQLISKNYIESVDNSYEIFKSENGEVEPIFKFSHSEIWKAVYNFIEYEKRDHYHLKFGTALQKELNRRNDNWDLLFKTVNHLNIVIYNITDNRERDDLFLLNIDAANIAMKSLAYDSAEIFLLAAISLRDEEHWNSQYNEMLNLYNSISNVYLLLSEYDKMRSYFSILEKNCKTPLDRLPLCRMVIKSFVSQNNPLEAINYGKTYLEELGFIVPSKINTTKLLTRIIFSKVNISKKSKEALQSINELTDPNKIAIMETLFNLGAPCYQCDPKLSLYFAIIQVEYSLKYGNSQYSITAYSYYGMILTGILKDYKNGLKYSNFAEELSKKYGEYEFHNRLFFQKSNFILPWHEPIQNACLLSKKAYKDAIIFGDFQHAAWNLFQYSEYSFYSGEDLVSVENHFKTTIEKSYLFKQETQKLYAGIFLSIINQLQGRQGALDKEENKQRLLIFKKSGDSIGIYLHYISNSISSYIVDDFETANILINKAEKYKKFNIAAMTLPIFHFYSALIKVQLFLKNGDKKLIREAQKSCNQLKKYGKQNKFNFQHKYLTVQAAIFAATGNQYRAFDFFEKAVAAAEENGFIHECAIAAELAGSHYINSGREFLGKIYIEKASKLYQIWGAHQKTVLLQKHYSNYLMFNELDNDTKPGLTSNSLDFFDTTTLMKASKLITKEIDLESFLNNMMKIVLENSGASKGVLLLKDKHNYVIEAVADMTECNVLLNEELYLSEKVPHSVINSASTIEEVLIYDNALDENELNQDKYIKDNQVKALLVLPLHYKNKMVGIIYLENTLSEGVFRIGNRVELLKMLSSDIVISLENSRLYNRIEKSNKELEVAAQKAEKTAIISQELAEKAQVADNAKGQFLSNLSHEIRTPMNAIVGMTSLLEESDLNQEQSEYLKTIKTTTGNLRGILNGILDFSEINSGTLSIQNSPCSLSKLLEEVSEKALLFIDNKDIKFSTSTSKETPHQIIGDYNRIKQAMLNIVDNAVKFTSNGKISIETTLISKPADDKYEIKFQVNDSGIGISEEHIEELFKAFTQEDGSTTRSYGGLGLGLAITTEISKLMGGTAGACKNSDDGSSVWFTFIIKEDNSSEIIKNEDEKKVDSIKELNILIVEDNVINQKLTAKILGKFGFKSEIAENGKIAIEKLSESHFDIVLMDCQMPIMDGYCATQNIRKSSTPVLSHTIPIIGLTANAMPGDREKCLGVGMDDYLAKPFSLSDLKTMINKWR